MKANQPTITGIVVEYNPFHNGHIYHIQQAREITNCDCLIAIMSPNFVQRGEPAFIDKWQRTQVALTHGVDLVLELPTHIALQSAETFATHAVSLLALAGITDLVYGSETGQTPSLTPFDMSLSKQGFSYAKAKNTDQKGPNNILGAYYEASANLYPIKTHQILRSNKYHGLELDHHIASATAIRRAYFDNKSITPYTPMNISKPHQITDYWPLIRYEIIKEQQQLASRFLISEGLENKLTKEALCHSDYQAFLNACTSKRYTISRIQRSLMHILLHTPLNIAKQTQIRVLGANHLGRQYIKNNALFVTSFKQYQYKDLEEKATQIYALPKNETHLIKQEKSSPIILP